MLLFVVGFFLLTYCPSNVIGGVTGHCWNVLELLTSTIHSWTSGLTVPGVGYRTVRVSGNELPPPILDTAITAPVANHGYAIVPTCVSLNDTNIICVPSSEVQIASGVVKISSAKRNEKRERKHHKKMNWFTTHEDECRKKKLKEININNNPNEMKFLFESECECEEMKIKHSIVLWGIHKQSHNNYMDIVITK